jgi:hypothetical protein
MERIYHLQTLQIQKVRENRTVRLYLQRIFDSIWRTKPLSIFGYEEGAGLSRTKVG